VRPNQDACLLQLKGDPSQWAYLLSIPAVWRDDNLKIIKSLQKFWPAGIQHDWFSDGKLLDRAKDLFMTQKERECAEQPPLF